MADADAKKRVQQVIAEKVKPKADEAFEGMATAVPELAKAMKKVSDGLRDGEDPALITTHVRDLTIKLRDVSAARTAAMSALDALEEATKDDDDFEADKAEIETLKAKLTKAKALLGDQIVKAKGLEDKATAAAKQGAESEKEAHREWDGIITHFEAANAIAARMLKEMKQTLQDAQAAVKAHDSAALKTAQDEAKRTPEMPEDVLEGKLLKKRVNEFLSKYNLDNFSREFIQEMAKDRATIVEPFDQRAQELATELKKLKDQTLKLAIEAPNAAKATAALGFKANFNLRVEAALKLDESKMAKALEEIARQAGAKATGKELVEKLKKAKLL
jgi:hypothetical protein